MTNTVYVANPKAIMTMIRNKLNSKLSLEEKLRWFHEKGITVTEKDEQYYLKADPRGHVTNLTPVCNNVIFHKQYLSAFPGYPHQETTLTELKNENFTFDETTVFIKPLDEGQTIYMYWDQVDEEWKFAGPKKLISPYIDVVKKHIKNIMSGEYCYTYTLKFIESGDNAGLYLESMFDHERFKDVEIERVIFFAKKFAIKHPNLYILKKGNEIEQSDLPVLVRDKSGYKYRINEI